VDGKWFLRSFSLSKPSAIVKTVLMKIQNGIASYGHPTVSIEEDLVHDLTIGEGFASIEATARSWVTDGDQEYGNADGSGLGFGGGRGSEFGRYDGNGYGNPLAR
jgi:hypothetical protein